MAEFDRECQGCKKVIGYWSYGNWLYKKFGNRVAFVQGVAPTENWTFKEVEQGKLLDNLKK